METILQNCGFISDSPWIIFNKIDFNLKMRCNVKLVYSRACFGSSIMMQLDPGSICLRAFELDDWIDDLRVFITETINKATKKNCSDLVSLSLWRDAHFARSKFTAENFSARSESGELSRDGHRPSILLIICARAGV